MKDELIKRGYKDAEDVKFDSDEAKEEKFWVPVNRRNEDLN